MDRLEKFAGLIRVAGGSSDVSFQKLGLTGNDGAPTRYGRNLHDEDTVTISVRLEGDLEVKATIRFKDHGGVSKVYEVLNGAGCQTND